MRRVAVIGGGVAGVAAALDLLDRGGISITLFEASANLGGKVRTSEFCGHDVEEGPDAMLLRSSETMELLTRVGLSEHLTSPQASTAMIYRRNRRSLIPKGTVLGTPNHLSQILSNGALGTAEKVIAALAFLNPSRRSPHSDDLGVLAAARFSHVYTRAVLDPLLGGINASSMFGSSAEVVAPQLLPVLRSARSSAPTTSTPPQGPVFVAPVRGLGDLITRATRVLEEGGVALVTSRRVESVDVTPEGVRLSGSELDEHFDGVVLAVPAFEAARLLQSSYPSASQLLETIHYAGVAVTTLSLAQELTTIPAGVSGILVAADTGNLSTAISIGSQKWPHWSDAGRALLRISTGRMADQRFAELTDRELTQLLRGEAEEILGLRIEVVASRVTRWPMAFPQFIPGHRAKIDRIQQELRPSGDGVARVALCGAYLEGSGIPTCIRTAKRAVSELLP